jgi:hypothetical protein
LIVILSKFDAWWNMLESDPPDDPWHACGSESQGDGSSGSMCGLDVAQVERQSQRARGLLLKLSPEIGTAAEGFAEDVIYIPASAVGWKVEFDRQKKTAAIRPMDAKPYWATVPFLYGLYRSAQGLIPAVTRR